MAEGANDPADNVKEFLDRIDIVYSQIFPMYQDKYFVNSNGVRVLLQTVEQQRDEFDREFWSFAAAERKKGEYLPSRWDFAVKKIRGY